MKIRTLCCCLPVQLQEYPPEENDPQEYLSDQKTMYPVERDAFAVASESVNDLFGHGNKRPNYHCADVAQAR